MRIDPLILWLALLAIGYGIVSLACLVTPGECVELDYSSSASGQGLHLIALQNNSSRIDIAIGNGTSIVRCNVTGMWEVRLG